MPSASVIVRVTGGGGACIGSALAPAARWSRREPGRGCRADGASADDTRACPGRGGTATDAPAATAAAAAHPSADRDAAVCRRPDAAAPDAGHGAGRCRGARRAGGSDFLSVTCDAGDGAGAGGRTSIGRARRRGRRLAGPWIFDAQTKRRRNDAARSGAASRTRRRRRRWRLRRGACRGGRLPVGACAAAVSARGCLSAPASRWRTRTREVAVGSWRRPRPALAATGGAGIDGAARQSTGGGRSTRLPATGRLGWLWLGLGWTSSRSGVGPRRPRGRVIDERLGALDEARRRQGGSRGLGRLRRLAAGLLALTGAGVSANDAFDGTLSPR